MFVIPSELDRETGNLRTYAIRHRMAVAFANYGGPSGGLAAAGRSTIWSEAGTPIVELPPSGAGIALGREEPGGGWRGSVFLP